MMGCHSVPVMQSVSTSRAGVDASRKMLRSASAQVMLSVADACHAVGLSRLSLR